MAAKGCYLTEAMVSNWPAGYTEAQKQAIINKAEQLVDKVTWTTWCAEAFDFELNGNNENRLFIPLKSDIRTVTAVYIHCIEIPISWIAYDENSIYLNPCASGSGDLDPELYYRLGEAADRGIFIHGYNNIRVVGTLGEGDEADVPEAIKQAATIIAEWENDPSSHAAAGMFVSEKIGDYAYKVQAGAEADILTGINKADMLLRHYVKRKPILMAP